MVSRIVAILATVLTAGAIACTARAQPGGAPPSRENVQLAAYAGYYQLGPHAILRVWQEDGRWYARLTRQPRIEIMPKGEGVFVASGVAAEFAFKVDARSSVTGLILRQNGRELPAAKIEPALAMSIDPGLLPAGWKTQFVGSPRMVSSGAQGADQWPCFSPDGGSVLFAHTEDGRTWTLMRAPATGGPAAAIAIAPPAGSATRPSWSATANLIAFTASAGERNQVWTVRPDGKDARAIVASGLSDQAFYPSWYPDGRHLVAMDAGDFVLRRFALDGGATVAVTDHARVLAGMPSVSPDGRWIAFAGQKNLGQTYDQSRNVIWLAGVDGQLRTLEAEPLQGRAPVWSPDGARLAFESDRGSPDGRYAVFIIAKDGTGLTQITPYALNATHPVWSPDGKHMVFAIQAGAASHIAIVDLPILP